MNNKKDKKTVWIYAVVLFTSAFIVLMITAYSQIKVNKNIDDVRDKLGSTEKEKSNFQMNLSSALAENKKLNDENKNLQLEIEEARIKESNLKDELNDERKIYNLKIENYEKLMKADLKYSNGDVKSCSIILKKEINKDALDKEALEMYTSLLALSSSKAALEFYIDGYELYKRGQYNEAIKSFENSLSLTSTEYYSDDCYYFIGYSNFNMGDKYISKEVMTTLLTNYPESTYKNDVVEFLKANFNQ